MKERENKIYFDVVETQIKESLFDLNENEFKKNIIANDPAWTIGSNKEESPEEAHEINKK